LPSPPGVRGFSATIHKVGINPCVEVPPRVSAFFGTRGRVPVKGTLNGHAIRGTLVPVGNGRHRFYVNGFMRKLARVDVGDTVRLSFVRDWAPRAGHVPVQALGQMGRGRRGAVKVDKPLWTCPKCGHRFVTSNAFHSCARYEIADHFRRVSPVVRRLFRRLRAIVRTAGPVTVYAQKTRIVFQARVRFGGCVTHEEWLDAGLWLARRATHRTLLRIDQPIPGCFVHTFRLRALTDLDAALAKLVKEAYAVGRREHLRG
jgi:hypothetical protein